MIAESGSDNVIGLALAVLALVYLLAVLVFPERF